MAAGWWRKAKASVAAVPFRETTLGGRAGIIAVAGRALGRNV